MRRFDFTLKSNKLGGGVEREKKKIKILKLKIFERIIFLE